jgi:hypothetical protein
MSYRRMKFSLCWVNRKIGKWHFSYSEATGNEIVLLQSPRGRNNKTWNILDNSSKKSKRIEAYNHGIYWQNMCNIVGIHCKDKIPKFRNKYSQKMNIGVSVPISSFMHLWAIYISPRSACLYCWRKYVDRSWDYINRSQTHECGNWGWGRAIPRKGIHKWDFRCSVALNSPLCALI